MAEVPRLVGGMISSKVSLLIAVVFSFLIAPSKVAAIAYALLLGGLLVMVFIGLAMIGALGGWVQRWWRS